MRVKCTNTALARFRDRENGIGRAVERTIEKPAGTQIDVPAGKIKSEQKREAEDGPDMAIYTVEVLEPIEFDAVTDSQGNVKYRKARVPKEIGERLLQHPSGVFEKLSGSGSSESEGDSG